MLICPHQLLHTVDPVVVAEDPSKGCSTIETLIGSDNTTTALLFVLLQGGDKFLKELSDLDVLGDVRRGISELVLLSCICEGFLDKEDNDLEVSEFRGMMQGCTFIEVFCVFIRTLTN